MNNKYAKACTQILEIIKYFPKEDYDKIPIEEIEHFKANMDKEYQFVINPRKDLDSQGILSETKAIIINLFQDYYATDEQNAKIQEMLELNRRIDEQGKLGADELFNHDKEMDELMSIKKEDNNDKNMLKDYKETVFVKLKRLVLKIFGKSL